MLKHKHIFFVLVFPALSGCAGMGHIGYRCEGHTKSDVSQKFGTPERVIQRIEGVETWEYTMGASVKTYTFQGDQCVRENRRSQN